MSTFPVCRISHPMLVQRHAIEWVRVVRLRDQRVLISVEHDPDGACCAAEPWPATVLALLTDPDNGARRG